MKPIDAKPIHVEVIRPNIDQRPRRYAAIGAISALFCLLASCMTPSEKKQMKKDLFNAQTRILQLEKTLEDSSNEARSSGDQANKRIANTQANMDGIMRELRTIRGEIDALRVGVVTGQMPGLSAGQQEGSIASSISALDERLTAAEKAQEELLDIIKKSGRKTRKAKSKKRRSSSSVAALQTAFDGKRYSHVVDDSAKVIKSAKGREKEQAKFLQAESLYRLGKLRDAALKFNDFIEAKPSKKYLPKSKMRMGDCFRSLGDEATASLYYEELVKEFPGTDEASKAKERLAEIAGGGKNRG